MAGRVLAAMVVAIGLKAGLYSVVSPTTLAADVHGTAAYLEVVGALYSITVAFVIFVVWEQFNGVQTGLTREGAAIEDLCRIAGFLNNALVASQIRHAARQYLAATADDEPRQLAEGKLSPLADERFSALCDDIRSLEADGDRSRVVFDHLLRALDRVSEQRDERLSVSTTRIPRTLWSLVVYVSCALFGGFLALGINSVVLALAVCAGMAGTLAFLLSVVADMDNPFDGVWNVSYAPMSAIEARIGQR